MKKELQKNWHNKSLLHQTIATLLEKQTNYCLCEEQKVLTALWINLNSSEPYLFKINFLKRRQAILYYIISKRRLSLVISWFCL